MNDFIDTLPDDLRDFNYEELLIVADSLREIISSTDKSFTAKGD